MPTILMPDGASAAGEAFELLSSRYLCEVSGLAHLAAPFYTHLERGRWVQFDGLFSRKGDERLVLEAKFYSAPISLATPGIAARVTFAKEAGASGLILSSRNGFAADIMRLRLPIEKVLLSWQGMRKGLGNCDTRLMTAALDPITFSGEVFTAASGARLRVGHHVTLHEGKDGLCALPAPLERWLRRLPAAPSDIDMSAPPRCTAREGCLDIEAAWAIEDSLRGFAPCDPKLLEISITSMRGGPITLGDAWKALWRAGYRGRRGGIKNAFDNLCVMKLAEKFRTEHGLFYGRVGERGADNGAGQCLADAIERWPAYVHFRRSTNAGERNKHAIAEKLSREFEPFFPYARSLYNPAKVAGLLALDRYVSPGTSTTSPS